MSIETTQTFHDACTLCMRTRASTQVCALADCNRLREIADLAHISSRSSNFSPGDDPSSVRPIQSCRLRWRRTRKGGGGAQERVGGERVGVWVWVAGCGCCWVWVAGCGWLGVGGWVWLLLGGSLGVCLGGRVQRGGIVGCA
eukprot:1683589-Pleurochrysis_carterae.AAC.1